MLVAHSQVVLEEDRHIPQALLDARRTRREKAHRHAEASPFNGKPPVELLDISTGWDSIAKFDVIIERLKQLDLYDDTLAFCPAPWADIEHLGLEKYEEDDADEDPHMECGTEAAIRKPDPEQNLPREMCEFEDPAVIVFRGEMLDRDEDFRYQPIGDIADLREATVIIFLLTSDDFLP